MECFTVKYKCKLFDLYYSNSIKTEIRKKRDLIKVKWYLDIFCDNKLSKTIKCDSEKHVKSCSQQLLKDLDDGYSMLFLF